MYVAPVNSLLESYLEPERLSKPNQKLELQVQLEWSEWGPCYNCHNSTGERNKTASCRVRLLVRNDRTQFLHTKEAPIGNTNETVIWKLLYKVRELSCRSVMLMSYLPYIANATGIIPNFVNVEICLELCLEGEEAKTLWNKLRANYRDTRQQLKNLKSGAAAEIIKPWRFQNQMSFLEPFMSTGSREGNLTDDSENSSEAITTTSARGDILETGKGGGNNSPENEESEQRQGINTYDNNIVSTWSREKEYIAHLPATSTPVIQRNQAKKRKLDDVVILLKQSMQQREERAQRAEERRALEANLIKDDPLYNFFISMYQLTKNMPQSYQHRIRGQVFQAVSLAEEEIMHSRSQLNSMSSSSNNSASNNTEPCYRSPLPYMSTYSLQQTSRYSQDQHTENSSGHN